MLGVRRRRGDGRVATGRTEPLVRDGRVVVAVDEVVRGARMVRLLPEHGLEDRRRLELLGVRLVGRHRGGVERERVEDRGLAVARVARGQLLHRLLVGDRPRPVVDLVVVLVEDLDRRDVVELALALRAGRPGARDGGRAVAQHLRGGRPAEGVLEHGHRDAPVGDPAGRVLLRDLVERLDRGAAPEGVEEGHGAAQVGLDRRAAGVGEVDLAELLRGPRAAGRRRARRRRVRPGRRRRGTAIRVAW